MTACVNFSWDINTEVLIMNNDLCTNFYIGCVGGGGGPGLEIGVKTSYPDSFYIS
jgi:hypothetical protein